jgi:hypothetical protein
MVNKYRDKKLSVSLCVFRAPFYNIHAIHTAVIHTIHTAVTGATTPRPLKHDPPLRQPTQSWYIQQNSPPTSAPRLDAAQTM